MSVRWDTPKSGTLEGMKTMLATSVIRWEKKLMRGECLPPVLATWSICSRQIRETYEVARAGMLALSDLRL